eukprot:EG_transcript_2615
MAGDYMFEEEEEFDPFQADMEALLEQEVAQQRAQEAPSPYAVRKLSFESPPMKRPRPSSPPPEAPSAAPMPLAPELEPELDAASSTTGHPGVSKEVPKGDFICVWGEDGTYVYVSVERPSGEDEVAAYSRRLRSSGSLLKTPLTELQVLAEAMQRKKVQERVQLSEAAAATVSAPQPPPNDDGQLWVAKYAPRAFPDLLSDNEVNLGVLKWLKEWDGCVFGNQPEKRPWDKLLLLTGGPGVGKTTLAHVLARHAGYFPVEVNASMERTEKELKDHLMSATAQQTTIGSLKNKERRPICLILDEIDGVCATKDQQSAISLLVSMAKVAVKERKAGAGGGPATTPGEGEDEDAPDGEGPAAAATATAPRKGSRQPKKGLPPLMRPVICICNNPYAPALRELKSVARLFTVPEVLPKRMAGRLEQICRLEALRHDRHALGDLCQLADGDIRSCLMTLQFLRATHKCVTSQTIAESNIGIKDQVRGLFSVWSDIFHRADKAKYIKALTGENQLKRARADPSALLHAKCDLGYVHTLRLVEDHPEQEKLWEGCFEHYPKMRYPDFDGGKSAACSDWFAWADRCLALSLRAQTFALRRFLAFAVAQTHLHCATGRRPPRLEYPRGFQVHRAAQDNRRGILRTLLDGLPVPLRPFCQPHTLCLDALSALRRILSPKLRISLSNLQLLSVQDKAHMKELTQKYVQYNVTFVARTEGHQLTWELDIDLDQLLSFPGLPPSFTALPSAVRQMLAREIAFEKVRQATQAKPGPADGEKATDKKAEKAQQEADAARQQAEAAQRVGALARRRGRAAAEKRDFFGRVLAAPAAGPGPGESGKGKPDSAPHSTPGLRFQFNEGFTNAIRRTVWLEDFL